MTKASDNGQNSSGKNKAFIGKDKVTNRRQEIVTDILADPENYPDIERLAIKYGVSVRTIRRDMQSQEILIATDSTVEAHVDGILIHHAWRNIRNRIIANQDVDLSVWLVNHRSKQANDDRLFEQFQQRLAQELAATGQDFDNFDPNEYIGIQIKRPNLPS